MAVRWREVRTAFRALRKTPGATAVAVATLTLGIGANTAIFSLLNAVVLRPLPVPQPDRLVALATTISDDVNGDQPFSLQMFDALARRQKVLSELFSWNSRAINNVEAEGRHQTAAVAEVSGNYYSAMKVTPLLGRFIQESDVARENGTSAAVAVISYRAWRNWYQGDRNIIGKTVRLEDHPFTVIGVDAPGFSGMIIDGSTDVTVAIQSPGHTVQREPKLLWLRLYGRLKPGVVLAQARAGMGTIWPQVQEASLPPGYEGGEKRSRFFARRITVEPAATGISSLRKRFSYPLQVLLGLVGAVLLIGCLNLANLALARAEAQQHQSGIRAALGATSWDLMRQPLIESLMVSFAGATLGLALAYWVSRVLLKIAWTGLIDTPLNTTLDAGVLAFTGGVAVLAALLFAVAPAWRASRVNAMSAIQTQWRSVRGGSSALGKSLLVLQIALSLVLVAGAMLFEQTLVRLHTVDAGYRRDHFLTLLLFPQPGVPREGAPSAYYQQLAGKLKSLPGVDGVSFSYAGPANETEWMVGTYTSFTETPVQAVDELVGPDFFRVAGMHFVSGQDFRWGDNKADANIAIISQSLAEKLFGRDNPVNRIVYMGPHTYVNKLRIAGVVNNASLWKVESVRPMAIYRPIAAIFSDVQPIVDLRTSVDPQSLKAAAENAVRSMGRHYSIQAMTVEERLDSNLTVQRLTAMLSAFFGAVALLIASIGLYGLMSFHIARRQAELGIRLALGAERGQMVYMVLREALLLAGVGCVLGLIASLAAAKLIAGILFGVSATSPLILGLAVLTLLVVAMLAALLPAIRASTVDPMTALRTE